MKWYFKSIFVIFILLQAITFINIATKSINSRRLLASFIGILLITYGVYHLLRFIDKKLNMPKVLKEKLQAEEGKGNQSA